MPGIHVRIANGQASHPPSPHQREQRQPFFLFGFLDGFELISLALLFSSLIRFIFPSVCGYGYFA